jgi:hypothetical protein
MLFGKIEGVARFMGMAMDIESVALSTHCSKPASYDLIASTAVRIHHYLQQLPSHHTSRASA